MSRSYRGVRPKANRVYSVDQVIERYGICRNTLSNWIKAGLRPVDEYRPQLFRGAELKRFHEQRSLDNKRPLRTGEFKCFGCKSHVFPEIATLRFEPPSHQHYWTFAICPDCGRRLQKILDKTKYDTIRKCLDTNTSLQSIDEYNGALPAGIGKNPGQTCPTWTPENERIIYRYQLYAGRFDPKTLDAHLASIRDFEAYFDTKSFKSVTSEMVARYRDNLIKRGQIDLSKSTIRHRASHLKTFFDWLVQQDGYRGMNKTVGGYFQLPKGMTAKAIQPDPRPIPTTEQVNLLLSQMPAFTLIQRRDKAIVAASFLFGTRANATASLRLGSVNVAKRKVYQDASIVRVKNGKSQTAFWFPLGDPAEVIVTAWIEELVALGCRPDDALFPPDEYLASPRKLANPERLPIEPWKTESAIRRAFERGCKSADLPYFNPHSVKHYLESIRDNYCRNAAQRKAWSYNLGHEKEQTTEMHYAKMTDEHRDAIFETLTFGDIETEEEKDLMLAYHEHRLTPGTLEFERAEQLVEARRLRMKVKQD